MALLIPDTSFAVKTDVIGSNFSFCPMVGKSLLFFSVLGNPRASPPPSRSSNFIIYTADIFQHPGMYRTCISEN